MFKGLKLWWYKGKLASKSYKKKRCVAAEELGKMGDMRAIDPLIHALGDNDDYLRGVVAEALGQLGDYTCTPLDVVLVGSRAAEALTHALTNAITHSVRVRDLTVFESAFKAHGQLLDALNFAATALGNQGDVRAIEPLINLLEKDISSCAAAEALGKLHDTRALGPLIKAMGNPNFNVRRVTAEALGRLGDTSAVEPLIQALRDNAPVRDNAPEGNRPGRANVGRLASEKDEVDFQLAAIEALAKLGDIRAAEPLYNLLDVHDGSVRYAAFDGLKKLGALCDIEQLIRLLDSRYPDFQFRIVETLGAMGDTRAVEPLIQLLDSQYPYLRRLTVETLGAIGDTQAVEPLIGMLGDPDVIVRGEVVSALCKLGDHRAVEPLILMLKDSSNIIRGCVARVLGILGDTRAIESLIRALADEDGDVRRVISESLAALGEPKWKDLISGYKSDFERLGTSNDDRAIEPLCHALKSNDKIIRLAAAKSLIGIAKNNPEKLLAHWQDIQSKIVNPHQDYHSDVNHSSDCNHSDHHDIGIGLSWPLLHLE